MDFYFDQLYKPNANPTILKDLLIYPSESDPQLLQRVVALVRRLPDLQSGKELDRELIGILNSHPSSAANVFSSLENVREVSEILKRFHWKSRVLSALFYIS